MSGKPAGRFGDNQSGHGCYPPSPCNSGSGNVMINGKPAMRKGDTFVPHACPSKSPHTPVLMGGSGSVMINGKPAGRLGDSVACGSKVMVGSGNVIIG